MKSHLVFFSILLLIFTGCASFRSDMQGVYKGEVKTTSQNKPVSVVFVFSHVHQATGYDVVPKLDRKYQILSGFDDIFLDALREFSNVTKYATYTEDASDVNHPERRATKDSLIANYDYTVYVRLEKKTSFANYFLSGLVSTVTATMIPVPYTQKYFLETKVFNKEHQLIGTYKRQTDLDKWVQALLIFLYPFHPEERKREEIYVLGLHDIFKEINNEGILK